MLNGDGGFAVLRAVAAKHHISPRHHSLRGHELHRDVLLLGDFFEAVVGREGAGRGGGGGHGDGHGHRIVHRLPAQVLVVQSAEEIGK